MDRLTFEGNFCDIAMCREIPGGSFCEDGYCSQRKVWERLKAYEDTGLEPETIKETLSAVNGGLAAKMEFGVLSVVMLLILISLMEFLLLAVLAAESIHQYRN